MSDDVPEPTLGLGETITPAIVHFSLSPGVDLPAFWTTGVVLTDLELTALTREQFRANLRTFDCEY